MEKTIRTVCDVFQIQGEMLGWKKINCGHINRTYRADYLRPDGKQKSYIVQAVNTNVFRSPQDVMNNIDLVTEYIHSLDPKKKVLHFYRTAEDRIWWEGEGSFWRVFNFIPSVTYNTTQDLDVVYSAGRAFGEFQTMLADFDASQLVETIPAFHDTIHRYKQLEQAVKEDPVGRLQEVSEELKFLRSVREQACTLTRMGREGRLPLRVTHNDTKINNVLFDETGRKAIVVVDLDTVMPGLVGADFGDAIRSAANTQSEDCRETEKVSINLQVFRSFTEGFLSCTGAALTEQEGDTLGLSCFAMTIELAVRFLTDYLLGDTYFGADYPEHNLVRARCQLALAKSMQKNQDQMERIIRECLAVYRLSAE